MENQNNSQSKSEQPKAEKKSFFANPKTQSILGVSVVIVVLAGILVWKSISAYVSMDMSQVSAPIIVIGPQASGILAEVYVKAGDTVTIDEPIARVGSETLSAKANGIVLSVQNTPGQVFTPGAAVITMIDPNQLRVVGKIDENKGLSRIKVGDPATFTVDAFGSKTFEGIVDEISPTSEQSGVVFSISDKREIKQFEVKIKFDVTAHPEFKNGMSAKVKVYAAK